MKIVLLYLSPNETTAWLTEYLKNLLIASGHSVWLVDIGEAGSRRFAELPKNVFDDAELIGIGCPVYHLTMVEPMTAFLREALPALAQSCPGIRAFVYMTYAGISTGKAFLNAHRMLRRNGISLVGATKIKAPHFYDAPVFPDGQAKLTMRAFVKGMTDKDFMPLDDKRASAQFWPQKASVRFAYPLAKRLGNVRALPITIDTDICFGCGKCTRECPSGALRLGGGAVECDKQVCIHCYHCTVSCPAEAITCDTEKLRRMVALNKRIVGLERPENTVWV